MIDHPKPQTGTTLLARLGVYPTCVAIEPLDKRPDIGIELLAISHQIAATWDPDEDITAPFVRHEDIAAPFPRIETRRERALTRPSRAASA